MIFLDDVSYDCDSTISRSAKLVDHFRVETKDFKIHRKIARCKFDITLQFSNRNNAEYERLRAVLLDTETDYHTLIWFDGDQWRTIQALISAVEDSYYMTENGQPIYSDMTILFEDRGTL